MTRPANTILTTNPSWALGRQNALVDLTSGGQLGFTPDLTQYLGNQSYIRKNLICVLLEAPSGFQYYSDAAQLVATLRALVELHPLSIEGLNATLEAEVQETAPVGGGGEMHQDFVDMKQTRSDPTFRWTEKYGRVIEPFFRFWMQNLMMDPQSKIASILSTGTAPTDMLSDRYSMTCAFIEPDPNWRVIKSWVSTNMFPHTSGETIGRREISAPGEPVTYDIKFSAISQYGRGVDAFCQTLLDSMNLQGANPYYRSSFVQGVDPEVAASLPGYANGIQNLAAAAVKV